MDYLNYLFSNEIFVIIFKLVLASFLAGIIGLERSSLSKPAGFGTHAILGLASSLIVISSEYMSLFYSMDVSRIPASVLPGIGFIGAGTILRSGFNVKGVTTAAAIFGITCVGLSVGMGYYFAAVVATIVMYLLLAFSHNLSDKLERYETLEVRLVVSEDFSEVLLSLEKFFKKNHIKILSMKKQNDLVNKENKTVVDLALNYDKKIISSAKILGELMTYENVGEVSMDSE